MYKLLAQKFYLLAVVFFVCSAWSSQPVYACSLNVTTQELNWQIQKGFKIPKSTFGGYSHALDCPPNEMKVICNSNWVDITPNKFDIDPGKTQKFTIEYNTGLLPVSAETGFDASCAIHGETTEPLVAELATFNIVVIPNPNKSFTFKCNRDLVRGAGGVETITMERDSNETCTVKLTQFGPGVEVEVSTLQRQGLYSSIKVTPEKGITDSKGELEVEITGLRKGIDWIAWAVPNEEGIFEFSKHAYDTGLAWGMFVDVR